MFGGSVVSPVSVEDFPVSAYSEIPLESPFESSARLARMLGGSIAQSGAPDVIAESEEFVALPGVAKKLQQLLPLAMRDAHSKSESFLGCMTLISEQEARLVTVITLWKGRDGADRYRGNSRLVKRFLEPYVDRWLRSGRFATVVSTRDL